VYVIFEALREIEPVLNYRPFEVNSRGKVGKSKKMPASKTRFGEEVINFYFPLVASPFCFDFRYTTSEFTVFGQIGIGVDLHLLDRFERNTESEIARGRIGCICLVNEQSALIFAGALNAHFSIRPADDVGHNWKGLVEL